MASKSNTDQADTGQVELTAVVVEQVTSPEERKNDSRNYILVASVKEILKLEDVSENLRIDYEDDESAKRSTPIHREIFESFEHEPQRFIQRHSGFSVVCDDIRISDPRGDGIYTVTLTKASLINGAQSQGLLRRFLHEKQPDTSYRDKDKSIAYYQDASVRIEVIVEQSEDERTAIAIARNSALKVSELSKMGKQGYFDRLEKSMLNYNSSWTIAKSETDVAIPTETLLQVIRTMIPTSIRNTYEPLNSVVKSYSGRQSGLQEFKRMVDECRAGEERAASLASKLHRWQETGLAEEEIKQKEAEEKERIKELSKSSEALEFMISFAPHAWQQYLKWTQDKRWIEYWENKSPKIGNYKEKTGEFDLGWAITCPLLHGLQHFAEKTQKGREFGYPRGFDHEAFENAYMEYIVGLFAESDYVPQEFAKNKSTYHALRDAVQSYKRTGRLIDFRPIRVLPGSST